MGGCFLGGHYAPLGSQGVLTGEGAGGFQALVCDIQPVVRACTKSQPAVPMGTALYTPVWGTQSPGPVELGELRSPFVQTLPLAETSPSRSCAQPQPAGDNPSQCPGAGRGTRRSQRRSYLSQRPGDCPGIAGIGSRGENP